MSIELTGERQRRRIYLRRRKERCAAESCESRASCYHTELVDTAADHEGPSVPWKGWQLSVGHSHQTFTVRGITEGDSSDSQAFGYWHDVGLVRPDAGR